MNLPGIFAYFDSTLRNCAGPKLGGKLSAEDKARAKQMLEVAHLLGPTDEGPLNSFPVSSLNPAGNGSDRAIFRDGVDPLTAALDLGSTSATEVVEGHFLTVKVSLKDQAEYFKETGFIMERSQAEADPFTADSGSNPTPFIRKLEAAAAEFGMSKKGAFGVCVCLRLYTSCLGVFPSIQVPY